METDEGRLKLFDPLSRYNNTKVKESTKGEQRCQSKQPDDIVRQELLIAMETEGRLLKFLIHCLATTTQSQRKHKAERRCQSKQPVDIVRQELRITMETDEVSHDHMRQPVHTGVKLVVLLCTNSHLLDLIVILQTLSSCSRK